MISNFLDFFKEKISQLKTDKTKLWKVATLLSVVLFLSTFCFFYCHFFITKVQPASEKTTEKNLSKEQKTEQPLICSGCVRREIDGLWVKKENFNLPPLAVMIDNHPSARPVMGLNKASLVYEAEVEGGYTRYMAIFSPDERIEAIGPIRSARSYFLDWSTEIGAIYTHCGGSPDALAKIIQKNIVNLNEIHSGQYFWRDHNRSAPHNVLSSSDNFNKFLENKKISSGNFSAWKFKNDQTGEKDGQEITINFHLPDFKVKWIYNQTDNDYLRYLADKEQKTAENESLKAKNIIIQYLPAKVVDSKLRLEMETIGQGKAIICQDGNCLEGEWKKENFNSRTKFYYPNSQEAEFNAGQTWIEIVKPEIKIDISNN